AFLDLWNSAPVLPQDVPGPNGKGDTKHAQDNAGRFDRGGPGIKLLTEKTGMGSEQSEQPEEAEDG
ncbi:MAG TPA: hypothetical protein VGP21_08630, partial [Opitutaceae bacterium]|nr:hypothetical protein [Opitutaceae bacterium]